MLSRENFCRPGLRGRGPYGSIEDVKAIPFKLCRAEGRPLVRQVLDGFREAITGGYYAPGDALPSYAALAEMLGVSRIVTKNAIRRLAEEGLVSARPRLGTVVRDRGEKAWRGHVVFVCPEEDVGYFQTILAETLRTRLNREDYLFTRASVEHRAASGGKYDFALLDAALTRSVDLVLVLYDRQAICRHLAARGVPFAVVAGIDAAPAGAAGLTRFDYNAAVPGFIAACHAAGARRVVQLRWERFLCDAVPALRGAGFEAKSVSLRGDLAKGKFLGIEDAGLKGFSRILASPRFDRDAIYFFSSEYLARGAITAMVGAGVRAPEDVRIAIWTTAGLGPAYFRDLARMEMDSAGAGDAVADAAIAYLKSGKYPAGSIFGPRWIGGETMRR